jgi:Cu-Zn family superoxide dismutase
MRRARVWRLIAPSLAIAVAGVGVPAAVAGHIGRSPGGTRTFTLAAAGPSDNPESVTYDRRTGAFYVSATGTGTIYRGTLGSDTLTPFLPGGVDGRTAAAGVKVDRHGRLYIAGGATGRIWVYSTTARKLLATFETPGSGGFLNDVVVMRDGDVFATDSYRSVLWHIDAAQVAAGGGTPEAISVAPEIAYVPGQFNLNGIAASRDGNVLWVVQTATGKLFRISVGDRDSRHRVINEVAVAGGPLPSVDGLYRDGGQLLAVQNGLGGAPQQVDVLKLEGGRAKVIDRISDPTFQTPTGVTRAGEELLVTNADFATNTPPYTVSGLTRNKR